MQKKSRNTNSKFPAQTITHQINDLIHPKNIPMIRRYNFKKANWKRFMTQLDDKINKIIPMPKNDGQFTNLLKDISKQNIPVGCRTQFILEMEKKSKELL